MKNTIKGESGPRLLVSVRNLVEARAALDGGCDLLDIKEPRNGPLGMANVETIEHVTGGLHSDSRTVPFSAALGEVNDWINRLHVPAISLRLAYTKLGTAGLGVAQNWVSDWQTVCTRFEQASGTRFDWIAVVYVDWQAAQAPPIDAVIQAALSQGNTASASCVGVLLDTYRKTGGSLLDRISIGELIEFSETIHEGGLGLALAGGLSLRDLPGLAAVRPDIIAIRTAACVGRRRLAAVSTEMVRVFKNRMGTHHVSHA